MPSIHSIKYEHIIIILICIILIGGILTQPPPRETFTELYFTNPSNLQRKVNLNEPLNITFTVKNHEYRDIYYSYEIALEYEQNRSTPKKIDVASGKFSLPNSESIDISEEILVKEPSTELIRVSVFLLREDTEDVYRSLQHQINVTEG